MSHPIHQCQCPVCENNIDEHTMMIHHQINVIMSRMDEQQRRWYAAVEANRRKHPSNYILRFSTRRQVQAVANHFA